mmetsp:Transcript_8608/g.19458  ORF Transcript_8608/g.19458 Transcript_8608/m.19458 type:complete len:209 (+) Transcript_8608:1917-2543(+)
MHFFFHSFRGGSFLDLLSLPASLLLFLFFFASSSIFFDFSVLYTTILPDELPGLFELKAGVAALAPSSLSQCGRASFLKGSTMLSTSLGAGRGSATEGSCSPSALGYRLCVFPSGESVTSTSAATDACSRSSDSRCDGVSRVSRSSCVCGVLVRDRSSSVISACFTSLTWSLLTKASFLCPSGSEAVLAMGMIGATFTDVLDPQPIVD